MGKSTRTIIAVVIFVALLGFGIITIIGQDNMLDFINNEYNKINGGKRNENN